MGRSSTAVSSERALPSLKSIAYSVLQPLFRTVVDVGDADFELVKGLLALATAPQLLEIEHNSPHLVQDTEALWKDLAIKDFVKVRAAVEDGKMIKEPKSWRAFHAAESVAQEGRMEAVLQKMRGAYKSHVDDRKTSKQVDGVLMAKRRKLNSMVSGSTRPKTLMEKARVNSRKIGTIYAPKRRPGFAVRVSSPPPPPPALPASTMISSRSPSKGPPPKIQTVTRTVKVAAPPRPSAAKVQTTTSLPVANQTPTIPLSRPAAPLPSQRPSAPSPPPTKPTSHPSAEALSPPPPPIPSRSGSAAGYTNVRPSARALNSIFLKRKR